MATEKLTPERAVRLLRAKVGELEARVLQEWSDIDTPMTGIGANMAVAGLGADIALIASILADYIEQVELDTDDVVDVLNERERSFLDGFNEGRPDAD